MEKKNYCDKKGKCQAPIGFHNHCTGFKPHEMYTIFCAFEVNHFDCSNEKMRATKKLKPIEKLNHE